jgi:hypothetical protein
VGIWTDICQPAVSKIDIYVTVVLNVATDLYLISIPAPVCKSLFQLSMALQNSPQCYPDALQGSSSLARKA